MTDSEMADDRDRPYVDRRRGTGAARPDTPIVPKNTIAGRALIAVVAIMTFLGDADDRRGGPGCRVGIRMAIGRRA